MCLKSIFTSPQQHGSLALCVSLLIAACVSAPTVQERHASATSAAEVKGWSEVVIPAGDFDLAAWTPRNISQSPELAIYIEGDGLAWISSDTPSADPTPVTPVALQLALAQPEGNAAYLARPCQFVFGSRCERRFWTSHRFAPEVVDSANRAVDALKAKFGAQRLTLVGYSGGGAVAALLAGRRNDVERLITVAGNLDHRAWTSYHRVSPLTGSLNAADERNKLGHLRQWHFTGQRDRVVPPFLAQSFVAGLSSADVSVVEGYDHKCCWAENWPTLWKIIR